MDNKTVVRFYIHTCMRTCLNLFSTNSKTANTSPVKGLYELMHCSKFISSHVCYILTLKKAIAISAANLNTSNECIAVCHSVTKYWYNSTRPIWTWSDTRDRPEHLGILRTVPAPSRCRRLNRSAKWYYPASAARRSEIRSFHPLSLQPAGRSALEPGRCVSGYFRPGAHKCCWPSTTSQLQSRFLCRMQLL